MSVERDCVTIVSGARASRVLGASHRQELALERGWQLVVSEPGAIASPAELALHPQQSVSASVPGTTALLLDAPSLEQSIEHDARDALYRLRLDASTLEGFRTERASDARTWLVLEGLATSCEVYLGGELLARSQSAYEPLAIELGDRLTIASEQGLELVLLFRALLPELRKKRPRGRWPTRLVTEKHLRFVRTPLLGYMPAFWPLVRAVGPYRPVRLVREQGFSVRSVRLAPSLSDTTGVLELSLVLEPLGISVPELIASASVARVVLERGDARFEAPLSLESAVDALCVHGRLELPEVEPWWPHTHGTPALYSARVQIGQHSFDLGAVGFRSLARCSGDPDDFGLRVNNVPIFCRGANHLPLDLRTLQSSEPELRAHLLTACDAGMNMLRVPGTGCYESDAFYRLCDELGILVFQDFMLANLDYPADDPAFVAAITREAHALFDRLEGRACLAVLCGGSEVAQQAAMMGLPLATPMPLHTELLPALRRERRPEVPYVPSSPSGGALPFHVGAGVSHYYGVGAYLRGFDDVRAARPRFAAECLAFAQIPAKSTLEGFLGKDAARRDPRFVARIPRDQGADWDFLQVSEHYARELSGLSLDALHALAPARYFALLRATTAETLSRVGSTLRARSSGCHGALVWFLRDAWAAAGLGLLDHLGRPKASLHALARAWAPRAVTFTDRGLDGLWAHIHNDRPEPLAAILELALHRTDGSVLERVEHAIELAPRSEQAHSVDALFGAFVDSSYAYRFGPPAHALVTAHLLGQGDELASRAIFLPLGLAPFLAEAETIAASIRATAALATHPKTGARGYLVSIDSGLFAPCVEIEADGFAASDDAFALVPLRPHKLWLWPQTPSAQRGMGSTHEATLAAQLHALFADTPIRIERVARSPSQHA